VHVHVLMQERQFHETESEPTTQQWQHWPQGADVAQIRVGFLLSRFVWRMHYSASCVIKASRHRSCKSCIQVALHFIFFQCALTSCVYRTGGYGMGGVTVFLNAGGQCRRGCRDASPWLIITLWQRWCSMLEDQFGWSKCTSFFSCGTRAGT